MLKRVPIYAFIVLLLASLVTTAVAQEKKAPTPPKKDPAMVHFQKAIEAHKAKKLDDAMREYKEVAKLKPSFSVVYFNMAAIHMQRNELDAAIPLLLKVEKLEPKNSEVPVQLVRIYFSKKQMEQAAAQAKIAVGLKSKDPVAYYVLGMQAFEKKNYASAASNLRRVVDLNPTDSQVRFNLAYSYMQTGKYALALKECEKLTAKDPDNLQYRQMAAEAARLSKNTKAAVKQYEAIAKFDPKDTTALVALAKHYEQTGDIKKSKSTFERLLKISKPGSEVEYIAIFNLGRLAFEERQFNVAKTYFAKACVLHPKDISAKLNLGLAETQLKQYDLALKHFNAALAINPKHRGALLGIAGIYEEKKDYENCRKYLGKLAAYYPKESQYLVQTAFVYLEENNTDDAEKTLKDVLAKFPNDVAAMSGLADIYTRGRKYEDAIKQWEAVGKLPASAVRASGVPVPDYREMIAQVHTQENRHDKAAERYKDILKGDPDNSRILAALAESYSRGGFAQESINTWRQVEKLNPDMVEPYLSIARVIRTNERMSQDTRLAGAAKELEGIKPKFPKSRALLEVLADIYAEQKQYDKAIAAWQEIDTKKLASEGMKASEPTDRIADLLADKGDINAALGKYDPMITKNSKDPVPYKGKARIYLRDKKYDDAVAQWEMVKSLDPKKIDAYQQIANIYRMQAFEKKELFDKAIGQYKEFLGKAPGDEDKKMAMWQMAGVYHDAKRYDETIAELREIAAAFPKDAKMMNITDNIARIYSTQGKYDLAIDEYVKALKADPKDSNALTGLTQVYGEKKDPTLGEPEVAALRKLIEICPDNVEVKVDAYRQIANLFLKKDQDEAASKEFVEVVKLRPGDVSTILQLARLYEKLGKKPEAYEQYRAAAKFRPLFRVESARMLVEQGKVAEAKAELEDAIKTDPKNGRTHSSLGKIYENEGKTDLAVIEYKAAITLDPTIFDATFGLMKIYEKQGKLDEAAKLQRKLIENNPNNTSPTDLMRALEKAGKIEEASKEYRSQIEKNPKLVAQLRAEWSRMLLRHDRLESALAVYQDMMKDEVTKWDGIRGTGDVYAKQGKDAQAISAYKQVLGKYPSYPDVIDRLEAIYVAQGKRNEFLSYMKDLVRTSQTSAPYDFMMAKFKSADRASEGLSYLESLQTERPNDDNLKVCIARWYADGGNLAKAIDIYEKLIATSTQDPGVGVRQTLAMFYEKAGDSAKAMVEYGKCVDQSGSPELRMKYAALLEKSGKNDDALIQYKKVLQMDPTNEEATRGMKRIDPNAVAPAPEPMPGQMGNMSR